MRLHLLVLLACYWVALGVTTTASADPLPGIASEVFLAEVSPQRATFGLRARLQIRPDSRRVLVVESVLEKGPAERAGVEVGDLILGINGDVLPAWKSDLERVLDHDRRFRPGDLVRLEIERRDRAQTLEIVAAPMDEASQRKRIAWVEAAGERLGDGLSIYCDEGPAVQQHAMDSVERSRRLEQLIAALQPHRNVRLTITRRPDGGFDFETKPRIELPRRFSLDDVEELKSLAEALSPGESLSAILDNPKASG